MHATTYGNLIWDLNYSYNRLYDTTTGRIIPFIKDIRVRFGLSLKEAKDLCEWYRDTRALYSYDTIWNNDKNHKSIISHRFKDCIQLTDNANIQDILPNKPYILLITDTMGTITQYNCPTLDEAQRVKKLINGWEMSVKITQEI